MSLIGNNLINSNLINNNLISNKLISSNLMFNKLDKLFLYNKGDECLDVTGGWQIGFTKGTATFTKNSTNMVLAINTGSWLSDSGWITSLRTVNKIDVSPFTKIVIKGSTTRNRDYNFFFNYVGTTLPTAYNAVNSLSSYTFTYGTNLTFEHNISSVDESVYIEPSLNFWGWCTGSLTITEMWLE